MNSQTNIPNALSTQRIRVNKISRWALAPVAVARTVASAIRLILKLDLDKALVFIWFWLVNILANRTRTHTAVHS